MGVSSVCCARTDGALQLCLPLLRHRRAFKAQLEVLRSQDVIVRPVDGEEGLQGGVTHRARQGRTERRFMAPWAEEALTTKAMGFIGNPVFHEWLAPRPWPLPHGMIYISIQKGGPSARQSPVP